MRRATSSRSRSRSLFVVAATVVATVIALITSPAAYAATYSWTWSHANGNHIMHAEYFDAQNVLTVDDQDADGHSAFVVVHNDNDHTSIPCWDSSTRGTGSGAGRATLALVRDPTLSCLSAPRRLM